MKDVDNKDSREPKVIEDERRPRWNPEKFNESDDRYIHESGDPDFEGWGS